MCCFNKLMCNLNIYQYILVVFYNLTVIISFFATITQGKNYTKSNITYNTAKIKILPLVELLHHPNNHNMIFLHIPKVGGTNISYITEAYEGLNTKRFSIPRHNNISPTLITENWIGSMHNLENNCYNDLCNQYNVISGHFPYGVHEFLSKKFRYITLVRHPIERELSSLNFDYQRGYIKNKTNAKNYILYNMLDNPQTRMLAGKKYMSGVCDINTLKIAKNNLDKHFMIAGVTDDTDTFIQVIASILKIGINSFEKPSIEKILPSF